MLQAGADRATRTGKLQFVGLRAPSPTEATRNWVAAIAALKSETLLKAALPDHQSDLQPLNIRTDAWYHSSVWSYTGYQSKFHWMSELDSEPAIPMDELWRRVALGRLGRAMKVIRRASLDGSIPLAIDTINQNICVSLGAHAYGSIPTPQQLSNAAIALDAVDPLALESALDSMSWDEVFRLRREILPAVTKLRGLLASSVRAAGRSQNADIGPYLEALQEIKDRHRHAQDEVAVAWRKIGFRTIEVTSAALASGLSSFAPNPDWVKVISAAAVIIVAKALGASGPDVRNILRNGRAKRASPLFVFDRMISKSEVALYPKTDE